MILLDTSILSLAFRRRRGLMPAPKPVQVLQQLIVDQRALATPGIVIQELLSGVRTDARFHRLLRHLEGFPPLLATEEDHRLAARIANACHHEGVTVAAIDCLIAAQTVSCDGLLFTLDRDFSCIARCYPLQLLQTNTTAPP